MNLIECARKQMRIHMAWTKLHRTFYIAFATCRQGNCVSSSFPCKELFFLVSFVNFVELDMRKKYAFLLQTNHVWSLIS